MADPMMGWMLSVVAIGFFVVPIIWVICKLFGIDMKEESAVDEHYRKIRENTERCNKMFTKQWDEEKRKKRYPDAF